MTVSMETEILFSEVEMKNHCKALGMKLLAFSKAGAIDLHVSYYSSRVI